MSRRRRGKKKSGKKKHGKSKSPLKSLSSAPKRTTSSNDITFTTPAFFLKNQCWIHPNLEKGTSLDVLMFDCPPWQINETDDYIQFDLENRWYFEGVDFIWYIKTAKYIFGSDKVDVIWTIRATNTRSNVGVFETSYDLDLELLPQQPLYQYEAPRRAALEWFQKFNCFTDLQIINFFEAVKYCMRKVAYEEDPEGYVKIYNHPINETLARRAITTVNFMWETENDFTRKVLNDPGPLCIADQNMTDPDKNSCDVGDALIFMTLRRDSEDIRRIMTWLMIQRRLAPDISMDIARKIAEMIVPARKKIMFRW